MTPTGIIILVGVIILTIVVAVNMYKQYKQGRLDMLDDMFNNADINSEIYRKYKKKLQE